MTGPAEARFAFAPEPGEAERLALRLGALSAFTFGAGRFWFKTAQRRMLWRRTSLGGDPFEYDGTALELLRGTALAALLLGLVLVLFNLGLAGFGLAAWGTVSAPATAFLNFVALLPLFELAKWRARRWRLLRTRWRGVRFGMAPGAAGFIRVWLLHALLTAATLGLARPWLRVARERHMTGRMLWGDARFRFEGSARALFGPWLAVWAGALAAFAALTALRAATLVVRGDGFAVDLGSFLRAPLAALILVALLGLWLRWRAAELRFFMEARRIADVRFRCRLAPPALWRAALSTWRRGLAGGIVVALILLSTATLALRLAVWFEGADPADFPLSLDLARLDRFSEPAAQAVFLAAVWTNYGLSVLWFIWVSEGLWRPRAHAALMAATTATGLESLAHVRSRPGADQIEADGLADALDAGGL